MNAPRNNGPSKEALEMLNSLQRAVDKALERKRRLGQYAVFWQDGQIVCVGEDAPEAVGTLQNEAATNVHKES